MKICVFCSANQQIDPDFFQETEALGVWAAKNGHSIVYGGVNCGLMECVAKAAHQAGGHTIGVIPRIIEKNGRISEYVDDKIMCDNLSERKQLMQDESDVFIALPGAYFRHGGDWNLFHGRLHVGLSGIPVSGQSVLRAVSFLDNAEEARHRP